MHLRHLREAVGVTVEQAAGRLGWSAARLARIEAGQTGVSPRDVRDLTAVYDVPAEEVDLLLRCTREARQKGWWQLHGTVLTGAYVGLEAAAHAIRGYEALTVPGLLQTEGYARALVRHGWPDLDADEADKRVHLRMNRQALLTQDNPPAVWIVVDEAVLHRPVGGRRVMREQLDHLLRTADLPTVTVQVLPFAAGAHSGMDGAFTMLLYEGSTSQNVVFVSNAAGGLFLEKEEELQRYAFVFDHLRANALPPDHAIAMIAGLVKEL
ncbi:helix-turn-helix domain-containing protein [Planosporangium sp. 12N6]|uniref:helix-turn-helix domain-containing protein n=1 Tax=Planosporangium spinosum TaxID=3402278 RepID=UPI003CE6C733